ncbi:dethiobiotin synthase [Solemya velesiana gill symbiont]|uniref:ATP-dependent dethiobiotin synthetase BioD n=1 Tax=Solemya velesiana gill symbiont TaxID=1918948 RepID=A0A1T2KUM8_9GAMM|nr:dethiobiotin synthase [Solemya velesiana gill symbiont]OOZ36555.1 dethiobiotin synthase [Solemya velesiana gill symbiont]
MGNSYFITGTDTECGKTEVTLGLMHLLQSRDWRVLGMKPIASGADKAPAGLRNEDAVRIRRQASLSVSCELVNPYAFEPPIAPHLAAEQAGVEIDIEKILLYYQKLSHLADSVIVEGVGGWQVPLGPESTVSDLAAELGLPVILVVGLKLGCINHALLTAESIKARGLELAGWVANVADSEMLEPEGNLESLKPRIQAPLLGFVPRMEQPEPAAIASLLDTGLS